MNSSVSLKSMVQNKNTKTIADCINEATARAKEFISNADFIKQQYGSGCPNWSPESTEVGALTASRSFIDGMAIKENENVTFFGDHIREAIKVVKTSLCK